MKIAKNLIIIGIFLVVLYFSFNLFSSVHETSCCEGVTNCPLYVCSTESDKMLEYEVLAFVMFFCIAGAIFEFIKLIKNIVK